LTKKVPWLRVFVEGVVIVSSILLAFGIEAWWSGRQDQALEKAHLEALREDLVESLHLLDDSTDRFDPTRSSLIALLGQDLASQPVDTVASWINVGLFALNGYEPRMSALADLAASDQLGLLTPPVRRQVSEVTRALNYLSNSQEELMKFQERMVDPFVVSHLPLASVLSATRSDVLGFSEPLPDEPDW